MTSASFGKVAVLYGGCSAERKISLQSGAAVYNALLAAGVDVHLIDTQEYTRLFTLKTQGFDRAFIMLHGRGGEDGQVQAILDFQQIPYTGSGMLACALAMDKVLTKKVWAAFGLPVQKDMIIDGNTSYAALEKNLGGQLFAIKPALEGSSVGVSCVSNQQELATAYLEAGGDAEKVMAECWVKGRELTYAVVGEEVLPGIEIIAGNNHVFYDYEAKYLTEDTRYFCPPAVADTLDKQMKNIALQAFQSIGATGWGRVDFMLDNTNQPWLLEINMAPGMTSHSLVPQAAQAAGWDFQTLVLKILQQTL